VPAYCAETEPLQSPGRVAVTPPLHTSKLEKQSFRAQAMEAPAYTIPEGFIAYPSQPPSISEIFRRAAQEITKTHQVVLHPWEELAITGKLIIDEILQAIQSSQMFPRRPNKFKPKCPFRTGLCRCATQTDLAAPRHECYSG
jgi:hypothetical protein